MNVLGNGFTIKYVLNKCYLKDWEAEDGEQNLNGKRHMIPVDSREVKLMKWKVICTINTVGFLVDVDIYKILS